MTDWLVGFAVVFVLVFRFWLADRILTSWKR